MMDFPDLVLGPCMDAFALAVTVAPAKSQPGAPFYSGVRGVWASKPVVIETGTGFHSTNQPTLGIRLADWDAIGQPYPAQGDFISVANDPASISWEVMDIRPDGQGGADMELRRVLGSLQQASSDPVPAKSQG